MLLAKRIERNNAETATAIGLVDTEPSWTDIVFVSAERLTGASQECASASRNESYLVDDHGGRQTLPARLCTACG